MRTRILIRLLLLLMVAAALAWGGRRFVSAGSGAYDLSWHSVDGGGGKSTNGGYAVQGSIGQPDAGLTMSGGSYGLRGGFWAGGGITPTPTSTSTPSPTLTSTSTKTVTPTYTPTRTPTSVSHSVYLPLVLKEASTP